MKFAFSPIKQSQKTFFWIFLILALILTAHGLKSHYLGLVLIPFLKAFLLAVVVLIYGILFQIGFKQRNILLETCFATGMVVTTAFFFTLGFLQQLTPFWFYLFGIGSIPAGIFLYLRHLDTIKNCFSFNKSGSIGIFLIFLFPLFYAALPPSFYDGLVYHLGIPNLYIQAAGFCPTPQFMFANTSIYYELSLLPAVFAGDMVPRFFHLIVGMVLFLAIFNFASDFLQVRKQWILTLLIITMPMTSLLLTTVKNDLVGALFILLGIRFIMNQKFVAAAVFWGFAIGVKYFIGLPLLVFLGIYTLREKKIPIKKYIYFSLILLLILIPLLSKNLIYVGNPVYPFLSSIFPSEYWDESRTQILQKNVGEVCKTFKDYLLLPYTISTKEYGSGGRVGLQFLIFLPFLFLVKNKKNLWLLFFAMVVIYLGCGLVKSVRFMFLAFLILSMFVALVYEKKKNFSIKILMFIIMFLNITQSIAVLNFLYSPGILYRQNRSLEQYKTYTSPVYAAIDYINRTTPEKSLIMIVGESTNYFLKRPYQVSSAVDFSILRPYLQKATTFPEWKRSLQDQKIDYLLLNLPEFMRNNKKYNRLSEPLQQKALDYFKQLTPIFNQKGVFIFPIN
jgi:hypothetical protein